MPLLRRLSSLLRADAHGMVDALSDDRLLLRQHLRDAEEALAAKQARLQGFDAEAQDLDRTAERLEGREKELEVDIELAMSESREDLARFAIEQLLPIRRRREQAGHRRRDLEQRRQALAEELERQTEQLEDLRLKVRASLERDRDVEGEPWLHAAASVSEEDVEMELLRRRTAAKVGGTAPEAQVGGTTPEAQMGGTTPEAQMGGTAPEAQVGGTAPEAQVGGTAPEARS